MLLSLWCSRTLPFSDYKFWQRCTRFFSHGQERKIARYSGDIHHPISEVLGKIGLFLLFFFFWSLLLLLFSLFFFLLLHLIFFDERLKLPPHKKQFLRLKLPRHEYGTRWSSVCWRIRSNRWYRKMSHPFYFSESRLTFVFFKLPWRFSLCKSSLFCGLKCITVDRK